MLGDAKTWMSESNHPFNHDILGDFYTYVANDQDLKCNDYHDEDKIYILWA